VLGAADLAAAGVIGEYDRNPEWGTLDHHESRRQVKRNAPPALAAGCRLKELAKITRRNSSFPLNRQRPGLAPGLFCLAPARRARHPASMRKREWPQTVLFIALMSVVALAVGYSDRAFARMSTIEIASIGLLIAIAFWLGRISR
jgi:hypothetical protein